MAAEVRADELLNEGAAASTQAPWPKPGLAWYAVFILAVVLMLGTIENSIINYLIKPIKRDFRLSDLQMSVLIGIAPSIFYATIGFPLARFVDSVRRTKLLSIVLTVAGAMTSLAGLTQQFWQFAICRMLVGGGGAVSNPAIYSLLSDYFPRERLTRAIAVMSLGLIVGRSLAPVINGALVGVGQKLGHLHFAALEIRDWQIVFLMAGSLGLLGALLMMTVWEPPRRGRISTGAAKAMPVSQVLGYVWRNKALYLPQFLALAFYAVESSGLESWRVEFLRRTYGWEPQTSGPVLGMAALASAAIGLTVGTRLSEIFSKRYDDANLRTVACCYLLAPVFATAAPLMPTPWLSILCSALTGVFGTAGVAPQNAALQSVTPNEMRGQITAIYYFVFTAIGFGLGPTLMAFITDVIIGDESKIRYAMSASAALMTPFAALFMIMAVKPYGRAIRELKEREAAA